MNKSRKTFFVCAGIKDNKLFFLESESISKIDAIYDFNNKFGFPPEQISRAFGNRKEDRNKKINIKFSINSYKAIYNDWNVSVIELLEPNNYVQVFFESEINGKNLKKPKEEIVHIKNIKKKI